MNESEPISLETYRAWKMNPQNRTEKENTGIHEYGHAKVADR